MKTTYTHKPVFPITCKNAAWAGPIAGIISVILLALSAKLQIPLPPIPITLQSAIVLILPILFGWQFAIFCLLLYFAAGAAGLPVFAIGIESGPAYFLGSTGGYLFGFLTALGIMAIGLRYTKPRMLNLMVLMLIAHAAILLLGTLWLAYGIPSFGLMVAMNSGLVPFIFGAIFKCAVVAAISAHIMKS